MGRRVSIILAGAIALGTLASTATATATSPASDGLEVSGLSAPPQTFATPPLSRTGTLDIRPIGFPQTDTPARNMVSATATQDLRASRVSGTVNLGAAPEAATESFLGITFGKVENGGCTGEFSTGSYTTPPLNAGYTVNGATVTFDVPSELAATGDWSCAFALLYPPGAIGESSLAYDGLAGNLFDVNGAPKLGIGGIESGGDPVKKLTIRRGGSVKVDVTLTNSGEGDADEVVLSGKGKGLKVKAKKISTVEVGAEVTGRLKVKVSPQARGGKSKLKLTAASGDVSVKQTIPVKLKR